MQLSFEPVTLNLVHPFQIAQGTSLARHNVFVRIGDGVGEAAAVHYHGETQASISAYLSRLDCHSFDDPFQIETALAELPSGSRAARAAIDIALHDWCGKLAGLPLYRLLGLSPARSPRTSFTIAIDSPEAMAEKAAGARWPILKIKVGVAEDEARIRAVRAATQATLRVDANGGWSRSEAARLLPILAECGVELVEQPLPVADRDGLRGLVSLRPRPRLFADESIVSVADIVSHVGLVDGVVVKLAKCGGIREAQRQIAVAHALGLDVMLGCMIESSVAVTAAAHLASLVEYVDLDGPALIQNDPARGVCYEAGRLLLPSTPGLGLTWLSP